jgi:hypothetical protein
VLQPTTRDAGRPDHHRPDRQPRAARARATGPEGAAAQLHPSGKTSSPRLPTMRDPHKSDQDAQPPRQPPGNGSGTLPAAALANTPAKPKPTPMATQSREAKIGGGQRGGEEKLIPHPSLGGSMSDPARQVGPVLCNMLRHGNFLPCNCWAFGEKWGLVVPWSTTGNEDI